MSSKKVQISKKTRWVLIGILLIVLVISDGYYLNSLYEAELDRSEKSILNELRAVAKSATMQINGDDHESLTKRHVEKDVITEENQNKIRLYSSIRETLRKVKEVNKLETNVYTIIREKRDDKNVFSFAVSAESPFYRHQYASAPPELYNNYLVGGVVGSYKTPRGYWLSAFEPIYNRNREVVGVVQIDSIFTSFVTAARKSILSNVIFSIIIFLIILTAIVLVNRQSRKFKDLIKEQKNNFKRLTAYAEKIGEGNYDSNYELNGENDNLGRSLIEMSRNLKKSKDKDIAENWLAIGRDKVSTILRENNITEELSYKVLVSLIDYVNLVQGALFIIEGDEDINVSNNDSTLRMIASYAYGRKKYTTSSFKLGEGLIGEAAIEKQTIHRTEIPEDHLTITSGLIKDEKPGSILIVPLVSDDKLQGVIELAGFNRFSDIQVRLIEELAEILARSLYNLKTTENTKQLLVESQKMTGELQEQQNQLEENAVEMRVKQEEIENTNVKLEEQITEVENAQNKLYSLLVDSSELIAIYDKDGVITYDSPSITKILGYTPEEMIGTNIFESETPSEALLSIRKGFNYLIENPTKTTTFRSVYIRKSGEEIVLEGTGKNSLDDPSVNGIVMNFRDITEQLQADEEVKNAEKRQRALLENASEVIAIYSKEGTITYESPSITRIIGYTPEEMVGTNIFASEDPSDTLLALRGLFNYLVENPDKTKKIQIAYSKKDGTSIFLEALGKNLLDEPAVNGVIINFRDITERMLAEKEQVMRGKMQALSENSEDIIIRFDLNGVFQYANPTLERLTGVLPKDIMGTSFYDNNDFTDDLKEIWKNAISDVEKEQKLVVKEVGLKVLGGDEVILLNIIPEFDANKKLETILLVAHDITDRKKQEIVLADTNKKITESINYAKRIQNAIIPSIEDIKKDIPETFMFYKPKDVVSGDFPYYFKKGDYLYYAAVDCTGHGVPGAMMSLIGHLLLNDILNDQEVLSPGEVLLKLHQGVVRTLKQDDENNKTADGMDIALCRINLKTNEIQYSGAHRPLYHVRNGELTQYKGDKYPIGGNQYKGKNSYETYAIEIEEGDSVFFFSDGLPDQFGGPNKLKYGPKQIREGIVENVSKSTEEIKDYFDKSYHDWMGSTKQIDDVLLIGIKF